MSSLLHRLADGVATGILNALGGGLVIMCIMSLLLWGMKNSANRYKYHICHAALSSILLFFLYPIVSSLFEGGSNIIVISGREGQPFADTYKPPGDALKLADALFYPVARFADNYNKWILLLYTTGLCFYTLKLIMSYYHTRRLKNSSISPAGSMWESKLAEVMLRLKIRGKVSIALSRLTDTPCIIGHTKALILIPFTLANNLTTEEAEAILLHELAHLKQLDYYMNLIVQVIKCLLFYNPFVWVIIRKLNYYRELSCDETAVMHDRGIALASSLVKIAETRSAIPTLVMALSTNKHTLLNRVQNLLSMKNQQRTPGPSLSLFAATFAFIAAFTLLFNTNALSKEEIATKLPAISSDMYAKGNQYYILVDALRDGFLQFKKSYRVERKDGIVIINGKTLQEPYQTQYADKYRQFLVSTKAGPGDGFTSFIGNKITADDVLDENSHFRKPYKSPVVHNTDDMTQKLVRALVEDKLIDPSKSLHLNISSKGIRVNGKNVDETQRTKYQKIYDEVYGDFSKKKDYETDITMDGKEVMEYINNTK